MRMVKKAASTKKLHTKSASSSAARAPKKTTTKAKSAAKSTKVDYYPNRMTLAVSVLAGTLLVLITIIAVLGSRS